MKNKFSYKITLFNKLKKAPTIVGAGLVALDVIINIRKQTLPILQAGGSCGNILTILSYLGWHSYPMARLENNSATLELINDLEKWKVNTSLISIKNGSTPIIIENINIKKNGVPFHRFKFVCPSCNSVFPRYKPVLYKNVNNVIGKVPTPQAYYFDRVTRSSFEIGTISKKNGALIMFEPTGVKNERLFIKCLKISDIVKYSNSFSKHAKSLLKKNPVPLEIKTMGEEG